MPRDSDQLVAESSGLQSSPRLSGLQNGLAAFVREALVSERGQTNDNQQHVKDGSRFHVIAFSSVAQDGAQQRAVDVERRLTVVFDEPKLLNLFRKKITRDRVVPTISASVS